MNIGILKLKDYVPSDGTYSVLLHDKYTQRRSIDDVVLKPSSFSFSDGITARDTQIDYISSAIDSLSSYSDNVLTQAANRAKSYIEFSMRNLQFHIFPVGAIRITTTNTNPQDQMATTVWALTATGRFLAGVGSSTDKNVTTFEIITGENAGVGEYTHPLSTVELPTHTHEGWLNGEVDPSIAGSSCESEAVRNNLQDLIPIVSDRVGSDDPHNNIPPFYGVYVWVRLV